MGKKWWLVAGAMVMGLTLAGGAEAGRTLHLIHTSDVRGTIGICG